jgi:hypothetical protein
LRRSSLSKDTESRGVGRGRGGRSERGEQRGRERERREVRERRGEWGGKTGRSLTERVAFFGEGEPFKS